MLSTDRFFDKQAMRTLVQVQFGGADFGECMTTMQRGPSDDVSAWYRKWTATADRITEISDTCVAAGHMVSAREAYLLCVSIQHPRGCVGFLSKLFGVLVIRNCNKSGEI